jgi:hypothetical protein
LERKVTVPAAFLEEVTFAVSVSLEPWAIFVLEAEMLVVVGAGPPPPPPPPPPQFTMRLKRATTTRAAKARAKRCLPGKATKNRYPKIAKLINTPGLNFLPEGGSTRCERIGKPNAVVLAEGARVEIERVVVAAAPLLKVRGEGETLQVEPLKARLPQFSVTVLIAFEEGVMVSVAFPVWPAVTATGKEGPEMEKSGTITVTEMLAEEVA